MAKRNFETISPAPRDTIPGLLASESTLQVQRETKAHELDGLRVELTQAQAKHQTHKKKLESDQAELEQAQAQRRQQLIAEGTVSPDLSRRCADLFAFVSMAKDDLPVMRERLDQLKSDATTTEAELRQTDVDLVHCRLVGIAKRYNSAAAELADIVREYLTVCRQIPARFPTKDSEPLRERIRHVFAWVPGVGIGTGRVALQFILRKLPRLFLSNETPDDVNYLHLDTHKFERDIADDV